MQAFFGSIPQNRCFCKVRTRCALKHLLTQSQRYFLKWKINPNEKCHAFGLLKTHTYILNFDKTDCDWFLKVCPSIREQQWNAQIKWSLAFQSLSHMTRNMKNDHDGSGAVWAWTCWICVDVAPPTTPWHIPAPRQQHFHSCRQTGADWVWHKASLSGQTRSLQFDGSMLHFLIKFHNKISPL